MQNDVVVVEDQPDVKALPSAPKKIPLEDILVLKAQNLPITIIAEKLNCSIPNVNQRLKRYDIRVAKLKAFKDHRADVLAEKGKELLDKLTPAKIQKASARDLATTFGILYDKERLERGQSTANVAYADMGRDVRAINEELKKYGVEAVTEDSESEETPQDVVIEGSIIEESG